MVDWDAAPDAEAPLALQNVAAMPVGAPLRELRTLDAAVALLDEWIEAYRELLRDHHRLELRCSNLEYDVDNKQFLLRHLDPYLHPSMQDKEYRAANEEIYAAIAQFLRNELD